MQPSKKAIVKAAERICAKTPGMSAEAGAAWNALGAEIGVAFEGRARIEACDKARLAMLQSIIEGNDIQCATLDGRRAVDL